MRAFPVLQLQQGMRQEIFYFGFRFEKALDERIRQHSTKVSITLCVLIMKALSFTANLHNKRKILFDRGSGFSARNNKKDKVEALFVHTARQGEMARNFAFAYRKSIQER